MDIKIVGAGLIGTSIGLALTQNGHRVTITDRNPEHSAIATSLIGGEALHGARAEVVMIATPLSAIFSTLLQEFEQNSEATFIDIGGLKSNLVLEVARIPGLNSRFCSTHPMAGREMSGPTAARADLFRGRPWLITPSAQTDPRVLAIAKEIASECGATVVEMAPEEHDGAIALISHLPQVTASLLGSVIEDETNSAHDALKHQDEDQSGYLALSGQGLRDTIRLASSDSGMWSELLLDNRSSVIPLLERFAEKISILVSALEKKDTNEVRSILNQGAAGKSRIPGKHGGVARNYHYLPIVIDDRPGQLARIFLECAQANVNIEDLMMEHSPGQETGLITLALSSDDAKKLYNHLTALGWLAHMPRANAQ